METDYLSKEKAVDFVGKCGDNDVLIIGIERFIMRDGSVIPDLEGIADFSALSSADRFKSVVAAREFLGFFGDDPEQRFQIVY